MKYTIDQEFRCESVERFAAVYFSETFNEVVAIELGLKERRLVEEEPVEGERVRRRVRMIPSVQLPGALKKLIGDHEINYDEVSTYDPKSHALEFYIDSAARDRLEVKGTIRFVKTASGVRRLIDCEANARVFGVGGLIERLIESEVKKSYETIAKVMQRYLDEDASR
jgi:hypothetical protein